MASDQLDALIAGGAKTAFTPNDISNSISGINKSYWEGLDQAAKNKMRNLFSDGVPQDENGNIDYSAVAKTLLQNGGAGEAANSVALGNAGLSRQAYQDSRQPPPPIPGQDQPANLPPSSSRQPGAPVAPPIGQGSGPNSTPATPTVPGQPPATYRGGDNGKNTLVSVIGAQGIPDEKAGPVIVSLARQLGVDPNAPLDLTDPRIRNVLVPGLQMAKRQLGIPDQPGQQPQIMAQAPQGGQPPQMSQAPQGAPQGQPVQQPQGGSPQSPQSQPPFTQPSPTPTQNVPNQPTEALANAYEQRANYFYQQGKGLAFVNPHAAEQAKAQGDQAAQQALAIRKSLLDAAQPTPDMKNSQASGTSSPIDFQRRQEEQKGQIAQSQKTYNGIQAQSSQYERDLKPYLSISKAVLNDPAMYTGTGGDLSLALNKLKAIYGDQKGAMLQEALAKVTASSVLSQINTQRDQLMEAGGSSGRIFSQQVDLVEKAAPALSNTLAGNRFLVEVSSRMGDLSTKIAQMSRDYQKDNGHLDAGFDQKVSDYMKNNPVFTEKELANPQLLGAPTVPPGLNAQQSSIWARGMGLRPGQPVRLPSGRYVPVPAQ